YRRRSILKFRRISIRGSRCRLHPDVGAVREPSAVMGAPGVWAAVVWGHGFEKYAIGGLLPSSPYECGKFDQRALAMIGVGMRSLVDSFHTANAVGMRWPWGSKAGPI